MPFVSHSIFIKQFSVEKRYFNDIGLGQKRYFATFNIDYFFNFHCNRHNNQYDYFASNFCTQHNKPKQL